MRYNKNTDFDRRKDTNMTLKTATTTVLLSGIFLVAAPAFANGNSMTGDYIEARSASVYAGSCHFNGEFTTVGREAVLAWKVAKGEANGVKLDGLRAVAIVVGNENLANATTTRRSVLYIDSAATKEQREAFTGLLKAKAGASLGTVTEVKSAPVSFTSEGSSVSVAAPGAKLNASRYPCKHCMMPAETWYTPLSPTKEVTVAQGISTGFNEKSLGVSWNQNESDNVFIGTFAL